MAVFKRPVSQRRSIKSKAKPYAKTQRKSMGRTRTFGLGKVTALTRNDFGFPDRLSTKLVYGDNITLSNTGGAVQYNTFRLNSLYDPDYTNLGHQPQWFDQLAAVYRNYRVKGAKIICDFCTINVDVPGTSSYGPWLVGITTSNQSTLSASTVASLTEDPNGKNAILSAKNGGHCIKRVTNTYSPSRDLGLDPMEGDLQALTTTNPAQQFFAHAYMIDMSSANNTVVKVRVKIEFQVEFFNRIEGVLS